MQIAPGHVIMLKELERYLKAASRAMLPEASVETPRLPLAHTYNTRQRDLRLLAFIELSLPRLELCSPGASIKGEVSCADTVRWPLASAKDISR